MSLSFPTDASVNHGWPCFSSSPEITEDLTTGATGYIPTFTLLTSLPPQTIMSFGCTGLTVSATPSQATINGLVTFHYSQPPNQTYPGPFEYSFNLPPGLRVFYILTEKCVGRIKGQPVPVDVAVGGNLTSILVTVSANYLKTNVVVKNWMKFTCSLYEMEEKEYLIGLDEVGSGIISGLVNRSGSDVGGRDKPKETSGGAPEANRDGSEELSRVE